MLKLRSCLHINSQNTLKLTLKYCSTTGTSYKCVPKQKYYLLNRMPAGICGVYNLKHKVS